MKFETFVQTCYFGCQYCIYYTTFEFFFTWNDGDKKKKKIQLLATDIKILK